MPFALNLLHDQVGAGGSSVSALPAAHRLLYVRYGRVVINGPSSTLLADPDVQRFYLGYSEEGAEQTSFRNVKHYKRRKRWLS